MLNTLDANGQISSRPMTVLETDFDGTLWFFASKKATFISNIGENSEVNLTLENPKDKTFISANGNAVLVDDDGKKKDLWKPPFKIWFAEGVDDPDLGLLKTDIKSADYWESPSLKVVRLLGFAKAMMTGKQEDLGKHGHLN